MRRAAFYVAAVFFACAALGVTASLVWDHHGRHGCPSGTIAQLRANCGD